MADLPMPVAGAKMVGGGGGARDVEERRARADRGSARLGGRVHGARKEPPSARSMESEGGPGCGERETCGEDVGSCFTA